MENGQYLSSLNSIQASLIWTLGIFWVQLDQPPLIVYSIWHQTCQYHFVSHWWPLWELYVLLCYFHLIECLYFSPMIEQCMWNHVFSIIVETHVNIFWYCHLCACLFEFSLSNQKNCFFLQVLSMSTIDIVMVFRLFNAHIFQTSID